MDLSELMKDRRLVMNMLSQQSGELFIEQGDVRHWVDRWGFYMLDIRPQKEQDRNPVEIGETHRIAYSEPTMFLQRLNDRYNYSKHIKPIIVATQGKRNVLQAIRDMARFVPQKKVSFLVLKDGWRMDETFQLDSLSLA